MAKMTKTQFQQTLAEMLGKSKKEAGEFWEKFVSLTYKSVANDGEMTLPGLGKLVKVHRAARSGRNPATGATISIPAKTVVKFRVASAAKEAVL